MTRAAPCPAKRRHPTLLGARRACAHQPRARCAGERRWWAQRLGRPGPRQAAEFTAALSVPARPVCACAPHEKHVPPRVRRAERPTLNNPQLHRGLFIHAEPPLLAGADRSSLGNATAGFEGPNVPHRGHKKSHPVPAASGRPPQSALSPPRRRRRRSSSGSPSPWRGTFSGSLEWATCPAS